MSKVECEPLLLPLLARWGDNVIRVYGDGFAKHRLKKHLGGNRFLLSHGGTPALTPYWIIDREGRFRAVEVKGYRREWTRPLATAKVIDLVQVEVEVLPGEQISASELLERIGETKSPPGFPTARHLRAFLKGCDSSSLFDGSKFREFWAKHAPQLEPSEWRREIPQGA